MSSTDPHTFICSQLSQGRDEGAIDLLAQHCLGPDHADLRQEARWRHSAWIYGARLADCVDHAQDAAVRARAGQLALRLLQDTLAADDRALRLNHESPVASGKGWLDAKHLCRAVAAARPGGVVGVLSAMLADTELPLRARTHALLAYGTLGGRQSPHAGALVSALLHRPPDPSFYDDGRLSGLVACGIVPAQRLCEALQDPASNAWFDEIVNTLHTRAEKPEAGDLVHALLQGLPATSQQASANPEGFFAIGQALHGLPCTPSQTASATAALHRLRQQSEEDGQAQVARFAVRLLGQFGAGDPPPTREEAFASSDAAAYLNHPGTHRYLTSGFAGNTPVHTPAGLIPIERLRAGDRVLTRVGENGPMVEGTVTAVHRTDNQILKRCTLAQASGGPLPADVAMTENHPVWCTGQGWYAAGSRPDDATSLNPSGGSISITELRTAYSTDQPHIGWLSPGRSRDVERPGRLWDVSAQQILPGEVHYDWDRWDPDGSDDDDEHALYRGSAWDLVVEDTHAYFVGQAGLWVADASLDHGFRRQYAAQRVALDAMFDEAISLAAAARKPVPVDIRDAGGAVLRNGDAVLILHGNRPGKVVEPLWVNETVAWIAVDEGEPGRDTLVPVHGGVAAGLRRR